MICTRPNIAYVVGVVNWFLSNPSKEYWTAVKWIFKYLRGTSKTFLCFCSDKPILQVYMNADMAGDVDSIKFLSGYLITFVGGAISWQSKLQQCVALSTIATDAITEGCKKTLCMKNFLQ